MRRLRHAMEIRHASFADARFIALLRAYGVALVFADTVTWPRLGDVTADFVYCRLHGDAECYVDGYDDDAISAWARRAIAWRKGSGQSDLTLLAPPAPPAKRDVFIYFDNTTKLRAPFDAQALIERTR